MLESIRQLKNQFREEDTQGIYICPETMGKFSQIGSYEEIIDLCKLDDMLIPTFDFGHINAYTQGGLQCEDDYKKIFDLSFKELGDYKTKNCHIHFSKIQYGDKGEIKHLNFSDHQYGPEFLPLANVIKEYNLTPHIICESKEYMVEDAEKMRDIMKQIDYYVL